jgi:ribosome-binding protein aMBF1 (putative translation factor)
MIEYSKSPGLVDAIEEGRIVKVTEDYARREGLLILRKSPQVTMQKSPVEKKDEETRKNKGFIGMEDLRRPLSIKNNEILRDLIENFHWTLVQKRKARGLTRKKVADEVGESELNIKMLENGVLPANNFILINKLESYYGINLRVNKPATLEGRPLRQVIDFASRIAARRKAKENTSSRKDSIEIIEDVNSAGDKKDVLDLSDSSDVDISKL